MRKYYSLLTILILISSIGCIKPFNKDENLHSYALQYFFNETEILNESGTYPAEYSFTSEIEVPFNVTSMEVLLIWEAKRDPWGSSYFPGSFEINISPPVPEQVNCSPSTPFKKGIDQQNKTGEIFVSCLLNPEPEYTIIKGHNKQGALGQLKDGYNGTGLWNITFYTSGFSFEKLQDADWSISVIIEYYYVRLGEIME